MSKKVKTSVRYRRVKERKMFLARLAAALRKAQDKRK